MRARDLLLESTRVAQDGNVFHFDDEGQLHRDNDEPAIEYKDGKKEYYKHGVEYIPKGKEKPTIKKTPYIHGFNGNHAGYNIEITYSDGTVINGFENLDGDMFYLDDRGRRHRDGDKPAAIYASGTKIWYQHDQIHRDGDKPACIRGDGNQIWYKDGVKHRENGPAVIAVNGAKEWWIKGIRQPNEN